METFQEYLHQLERIETTEQAKKLVQNPFTSLYELGSAKCGLYDSSLFQPPSLMKSGACPLFAGFNYAWGGLPYPRDHAVFGLQLQALGYEEEARRMAYFQQMMLDREGKLLSSFFTQESMRGMQEADLFSKKLIHTCAPDPLPDFFSDGELGITRAQWEKGCGFFFASGCLSSQCALMHQGVGVVSAGPQATSIGDCSSFGIIGRGKQIEGSERGMSAVSTLGVCMDRRYTLPDMKDGKIDSQWLRSQVSFESNMMRMTLSQKALYTPLKLYYSFFLKGENCFVSKLHKLNPKSLDRYVGPPDRVEVIGAQRRVSIEFEEGVESLEVIPLAGDESFWGADFLAFISIQPKVTFKLQAH